MRVMHILLYFFKQAACSLCVDVGNFSDPPEFPGISYFLAFEYMFFRKVEEVLKHDAQIYR